MSRFSGVVVAWSLVALVGSSLMAQDSVVNARSASTRGRSGPKVGGQPLSQPAKRLLPTARGHRPVVQPAYDPGVRHHQLVNVSKVPGAAPALPAGDSAPAATPTAESQLEFRLEAREVEARLEFAQARTQALQQQLARFAEYNQFASPETLSMLPGNALPYSPSYAPVTLVAPVALGPVVSFSPRSTFSHVLAESRQRLRDSELEVQALLATQQRLEEGKLKTNATQTDQNRTSYAARLDEMQAEQELAQFRANSARLREEQFDQWAVAGGLRSRSANPLQSTAISPFSPNGLSDFLANTGLGDDLEGRIRLKRLEHELRVTTLEDQGAAIRAYLETSSRRQADVNVAVERPKVQPQRQWTATTSN